MSTEPIPITPGENDEYVSASLRFTDLGMSESWR